MKLMIFGIDALPPDVVFENMDLFPNMKRICDEGIGCSYDAYAYGYGSRDNWISLYTGLTPEQHGVINNQYKDTGREPILDDYKDKQPFWQLLNVNGISVGMWKALSTTPPEAINGYMISGEISYEADAYENPYASLESVFNEKDKSLVKYISGKVKNYPVPVSSDDMGYTWNDVLSNPKIASDILKDDYFHKAVEYLDENLKYFKSNIINMQQNNPVDVCFFYNQLIDYIAHFQLHDKKKKEVIKAVKLIDDFIGEIIDALNPENVMIISDHGIKSWNSNFLNATLEMQKEMFGLRNEAVWLENGSIVIRARNKGFLSAMHDIKGTFIAGGNLIKQIELNEMRTVDFYPTLLELFDINVPDGRDGFVLDIFKKKNIVNLDKLLHKNQVIRKKIAIVQNIDIPRFNTVLNKIFLSYRFYDITVIGEKRYKDAFLSNPRISNIVFVDNGTINRDELLQYDKVIISYKNDMTNEVNYYEM
ncbi:alkaline phosphatase family protein [Clostridium sp. ZBS12]|uniref:alkaline phosphatase family protein n=1 Tax=Clostridium sp. ZBS12 TaxID=2949972 RepID=UPI00207AD3BC|nr:alkaline phosphatase family protein [Clostridium sp. ZBS12]